MNSKEALERIKIKYKHCLVQEARRVPFSSDINIENIEEYWHTENKNDFSQIEKDLEVLEIMKKYLYYDNKNHCIKMKYIYKRTTSFDYEDLKEWLEK